MNDIISGLKSSSRLRWAGHVSDHGYRKKCCGRQTEAEDQSEDGNIMLRRTWRRYIVKSQIEGILTAAN